MTENAGNGAGSGNGTGTGESPGASSGAGAGGGEKPWFEGASPEVVAHIQGHGWDKKDMREAALLAAQSHFSAQKMIGVPESELLRIPKPEDSDGWAKVYERLGAPKEYSFADLKFKDGTAPDASFTDWLKQTAAALHLSENGAKEFSTRMLNHLDGIEADEAAERTAKMAADRADLAKKWGPDADAHLFVAQRTAKALNVTDEEIATLQEAIGYGKVMEMFRQIGEKTGEARFVNQTTPNGEVVMTRDMAINRKGELEADLAWRERYLNGGKKELNEMMALSAIVSGTGTRAAA